jgi:hypothetical protein
MGKKSLKTLAKELDFINELEYYDYIINSHTNGQPQQGKELFQVMKKEDQKSFLKYIKSESNSDLYQQLYNIYFNLL